MSITHTFIDHKRSVILFMLLCLFFGISAYQKIPREEDPDIKIPLIIATIVQDGISPEDCQRMIISPLETEFKTIEGIKHIKAYASMGNATFHIEFIAGADIDKAMQDVRNKYDDALFRLPQDAKRAVIRQIDLGQKPVLSIAIFGDIDERTLIEKARSIKKEIEKLKDIRTVKLVGDKTDIIEIEIKPAVFESYKLSPVQLGHMISTNNRLLALGSLSDKVAEYDIKIPNLITTPQDLIKFPVFVDPMSKSVVLLSDVAIVKDAFRTPTTICNINGKLGVVINVSKRSGANTIQVVSRIKDFLKSYSGRNLPSNLTVLFGDDSSHRIQETIADLENGILFAALLVLMIIIISVGVRAALIVAFSLPISFFIAILFLHIFDLSLNIVVLFSLILTVGMVVDDAIVVSEYADCKMIEGKEPKEAFIEAVTRMFAPIFSATLVKIIVFLPLLFWPGIIGEFMKYMPITVIIIMSASLIFALLFQPVLGAMLIRGKQKYSQEEVQAMHASENCDVEKLGFLTKKYAKLLEKVLANSKKFLFYICSGIITIYVLFITCGPGVDFFPDIEPETLQITVHGQGNLSIWEKERMFQKLHEKLPPYAKNIRFFHTAIGSTERDTADVIGVIKIELADWRQREKARALTAKLSKDMNSLPGIYVEIANLANGPKAQKPISISICGSNISKIQTFTQKVLQEMKKNSAFIDIESSLDLPALEWQIKINKSRAAAYGISPLDVSSFISMMIDGMKVSSINRDEEVDVVIRFPREYRNLAHLRNLNIVSQNGKIIPLSAIAEQHSMPKVGQLKLIDGDLTISIDANVQQGKNFNHELAKIKKFIKANIPDELEAKYLGDEESQNESKNFLKTAFVAALLMMTLVILIQFNSLYDTFVVMSAVFLSTGGVLLGLLLAWESFGIVMSGIGVIALSGIVLNNNILFVDTYQNFRKKGNSVHDAIMKAGIQRIRPILLTAATAVLGLLPLVMKLSINFIERTIYYDAPSSQWWTQLATSIVGGLTFATVLTLFCTPAMLMVYHSRKERALSSLKPQIQVAED